MFQNKHGACRTATAHPLLSKRLPTEVEAAQYLSGAVVRRAPFGCTSKTLRVPADHPFPIAAHWMSRFVAVWEGVDEPRHAERLGLRRFAEDKDWCAPQCPLIDNND